MSAELHVWGNGYDRVVAKDETDILAVLNEHYGYGDELDMKGDGDFAGDGWKQEPDDKPLTISYEDTDEPPGTKKTKTMAEWCAEQGRGFLCSTES